MSDGVVKDVIWASPLEVARDMGMNVDVVYNAIRREKFGDGIKEEPFGKRRKYLIDLDKARAVLRTGDDGYVGKNKKLHYEGLLKEQEYRLKAGELVSLREVVMELRELSGMAASRMRLLPDKVSAQLTVMGDEVEINRLLYSEVDKIMGEYVEGIEDMIRRRGG